MPIVETNMIEINMIDTDMTETLSRFLDVNVARYRLIADNLANVETPGYRTRDLDFQAELRRASLPETNTEAGLAYASFAPVARAVRGLLQRPDGNNVSLERESMLLAETQMRYNLGVQLLKDEFHSISQAINSGGTTS
jgi:flagellar basal-body rod protein FlgB